MTRGIAVLALAGLAVAGCGHGRSAHAPVARGPAQSGLPVVGLGVGGRLLRVEVAATQQQRQVGLMNRPSLPRDAGMLFVYHGPHEGGYWMKDTLIPLSIAFMTRQGTSYRIIAIRDMVPCPAEPCPTYGPDVPYEAALEVSRGWFASAGAGVGTSVVARGALPSAS